MAKLTPPSPNTPLVDTDGKGSPAPPPVSWTGGRFGYLVDRWSFSLLMPRQLLLQVAHPAISAGVVQHSSYQSDPWPRLVSTDRGMRQVYCADEEQGRRTGQTLRDMHRPIRGHDRHGRRYSALRPDVFLWVHATNFDAVLTLCALRGEHLDPSQVARLYQEWKLIGHRLGIPDRVMPTDMAAFDAYYQAQLSILEPTESVGHLLGPVPFTTPVFLRRAPLGSWLWRLAGRLTFRHINRAIIATLPSAAVDALGLPPPRPIYRTIARAALRTAHRIPRQPVRGSQAQ
ncbi:oxygenase MpaB family protein [Streptomyces olivoreticuli]